jgi:hypothetical protein
LGAALPTFDGVLNSSGNLAIFAAIRRAASRINIVGPALGAKLFDVPPVTDPNCEYDLFIWARIDGRIMSERVPWTMKRLAKLNLMRRF